MKKKTMSFDKTSYLFDKKVGKERPINHYSIQTEIRWVDSDCTLPFLYFGSIGIGIWFLIHQKLTNIPREVELYDKAFLLNVGAVLNKLNLPSLDVLEFLDKYKISYINGYYVVNDIIINTHEQLEKFVREVMKTKEFLK